MPKYTKQKLLEFQKELEAENTKLAEEKRQLQEHGSQIHKESQELARSRGQVQEGRSGSSQAGQFQNRSSNTGGDDTISRTMGTIGGIRKFSLNEDFEV